ncbi:MAG TPA: hypothetical protein VLA61_11155 [Ideonella sp.]|uniref:hypothetical protein n=1 Tax=Ideonella sp. TaxID=1929293 RepID=UPI002C73A36F|nr:hypothetical protein [Ideonella sp.]HSI48821.1 hypothetical protein [Ideonella sp.]
MRISAPTSMIGRWLSARSAPFMAPDNSELDLGYESALPWFASQLEEAAPEPSAEA